MKRVFLILPLIAIALFALGVVREWMENDDEITHFRVAPEDELQLEFGEPFGLSRFSGTLTGSRGETLEDAVIYILGDQTPYWDRTNSAGQFELKRLPAGPWRVLVVARGYQPQTFHVADDKTARTLVLLNPIEPLPELEQLAEGDLAGQLYDPNSSSAQLSGYEVSLQPEDELEVRSTPFPRRVVTQADGSFELLALSAGRYRIRVLPPWARGGTWPDLCAVEAREFVFDPTRGELELSLPVERGEVHGRLTDSKGSFLQGAIVIVESAEDARRVWPTVSTSREGSFLIMDLPPGAYEVRARAGAGETRQRVEVRAGLTLNLDLDPLATRRTPQRE